MSRMPRLIRDVRRRRLIGMLALSATIGVVVLVGAGTFSRFRDGVRAEAQRKIAMAESRLARIDEISPSALLRLCCDWTNSVEQTSGRLRKLMNLEARVAFLAFSRRQDCHAEVTRLTNEWGGAVQQLVDMQNAFSGMVEHGRAVVAQMDVLSRKDEDQGVESASSALHLFRDSLAKKKDSLIELLLAEGDCKKTLGLIDKAWEAVVAKDEWKLRSSLSEKYRGLTNELQEIVRGAAAVEGQMVRIGKELADLPYDGLRSVDAIRTILVAKLDEHDKFCDEAERLIKAQQAEFLKLGSASVHTMEDGSAELDELRQQHGSYVNAECYKEVSEIADESSQLRSLFAMRIGAAFLSVSNELVRLGAVRQEIISVTNQLGQVDAVVDKRAEEICQGGMSLALEMDLSDLRRRVKTACDITQEASESIGSLVKRFTDVLGRIKVSLPDWRQLAVKITAERRTLNEENGRINEEFESVSKVLCECRADNESVLNPLTAACREISAGLRVSGASCAERVVCTNGVSAERLIQTNGKIKKALGVLWEKVCALKEETNKRLSDSSIYRVGYRRDPLLFQNSVVAGSRKVEFAVDVERAGAHRIAIQLKKRRGNYLLRTPGRHNVKIRGTISDGCGGTSSGEELVNDSTASWRQLELTALESKCTEGKNCFRFGIEFYSEGHGVEKGEWRFDLLDFEVWIDGKRTEEVYRLERL